MTEHCCLERTPVTLSDNYPDDVPMIARQQNLKTSEL